ncbi:TPA: hypothetical protein NI607_004644 [Pseudomonas aeruginosa]|nr:hypothetical protein [Pseudomonas aeruginosa]HCF9260451.1 hypothetical protein [Pseudomonas aeruginosa]HCF9325294.1 hypothetical protein [Pseudomonas aeruginosa]HCF9390581.1 hypothetical protein [Pseudomonas aeruginosa]HCF9403656.1 hypothetical protein [Pseudomonas aeruginosa]
MNLATLLSNQCSRVPDEVLTDKQIRSIKLDRGTARHAAQNMALGVAAVGKLLALTSAEGEIGQETADITIAGLAGEDLIQLLTELEVPA